MSIKKPKHVITLHNEWVKEHIQNGTVCAKCGRGEPARLTADHVIPLSLLAQFGIPPEFDPENLELLCYRCNVFKGGRLDFTNPKTKPLLIRYIERI